MAESTVEVTQKEVGTKEKVDEENRVAITEGKLGHVESHVWWFVPEPEVEASRETFTRDAYEDALDKVSRSIQGKYADVMPSTEEFIRQRREEEAEVEDRQP